MDNYWSSRRSLSGNNGCCSIKRHRRAKTITLYEEVFQKRNLPKPVPVNIKIQQSFQNSTITAIRVQDIVRDLWFSWDNGVWDNAGGTGNNAPVGQTPVVTPGTNNLYIAFYAVNNGKAGQVTLQLYANNGATTAATVVYLRTGQGGGFEWTGNMPTTPFAVALMASP